MTTGHPATLITIRLFTLNVIFTQIQINNYIHTNINEANVYKKMRKKTICE